MSNLNKKTSRVSVRQLELLWEFLNSNKDIASAYNRSLQAKDYAHRKWDEITATLNAIGDGVHKDWKGWSKYWVDFKAKLKKRVAAVRASQTRTGGGPSTEQPLSEIETKFLSILGENFGQGLPGIRVEPFAQITENATMSVDVELHDSPASESILIPFNAAATSEVQDPQVSFIFPIESPPVAERQPSPDRTRTPSPIVYQAPTPAPVVPTPAPAIPTSAPATPTPAPAVPTPAPAAAAASEATRSPRRRRRRRDPPMTQEAARRALVQSSQMRAEAALRNSVTFEAILDTLRRLERNSQSSQMQAEAALRNSVIFEAILETLQRLERIASVAFPRADERGNSA